MKALVRYGAEPKAYEVRDVPDPQPSDDELVLKATACGVCGSDLSGYKREMRSTRGLPSIPGHEFSGEVVEVGKNVTGFSLGDRVTCETAASICGECSLCRTGNYNLCRHRRGYGFGIDGAFAEYVKVRPGALHHLPEELDAWKGSLTEPACVAYNGVGVHSKIEPGDVAVIIGTGCIGLMALQVAKLFGATTILTGVTGDEKRMEAARHLGADMTINTDETNAQEVVNEQTDGLGAHIVIDCVGGVPATMELALQLVRPLGQITKIGWFHAAHPFNLNVLLSKTIKLQGSFSHTWPTWERALKLLAENKIQADPIASHKLTLDQWQDGYELSISREAVKAVIFPNGVV